MPWHKVSPIDSFEIGTVSEAVVSGTIVAVARTAEGFYVLEGLCPHQGGPLGQGTLCEDTLQCPWHGLQFDVRSGESKLSHMRQATFPTKVEDGDLYVRFEE